MSSPSSPFGQNEWLVEEMYRKFREDPSSVDPSWHEFLVDYSPEPTTDTVTTTANGRPSAPAAPTAPPEPGPAPVAKAAPAKEQAPVSANERAPDGKKGPAPAKP